MKSSTTSNWLIPTGLLVLGAVPVIAGGLRLGELAGGASVLPDGERVMSAPVPLVAHIVSVTVFSVLGAFQFAPRIRQRHRGWHRAAGRVVVPCGLLAALTGLWLTLFLPPAAVDSDVLVAIRVVVSVAMATTLLLGLAAIRRRDITRHRAWIIRGYAIGMGAGTQFFTQTAWLVAVGPLTPSSRTGTMAAGWLINVVVAEWIIRRRPVRPTRRRDRDPRARRDHTRHTHTADTAAGISESPVGRATGRPSDPPPSRSLLVAAAVAGISGLRTAAHGVDRRLPWRIGGGGVPVPSSANPK